jgi:hypothetical protein
VSFECAKQSTASFVILYTHAGPVLQSQAAPPQAQQATAPGHCCGGFVVGLQQTLLPGPHARHVPPAAVKPLLLLLLLLVVSTRCRSESTRRQHSPSASRMWRMAVQGVGRWVGGYVGRSLARRSHHAAGGVT